MYNTGTEVLKLKGFHRMYLQWKSKEEVMKIET